MAAYLHVSVYAYAAHGASGAGTLPIPQEPSLAEWQIEIGLDSVQSQQFPENSTFIMVRPEVSCCLAFGHDPEAVAGVKPVDRGERLWFGVHSTHRLAVIENS